MNVPFARLALLLLSFAGLSATEIRLLPPHLIASRGENLVVSANASSDLLKGEVGSYLDAGITLTFTYFIEFAKAGWPLDDRLARIVVNKKVWYDLWTERYVIETEGRKNWYLKSDEVRDDLSSLRNVAVVPVSLLEPSSKYLFRTRLVVKITEISPLFRLFFNVISVFRYRTSWLESPRYAGISLAKGVTSVAPPGK